MSAMESVSTASANGPGRTTWHLAAIARAASPLRSRVRCPSAILSTRGDAASARSCRRKDPGSENTYQYRSRRSSPLATCSSARRSRTLTRIREATPETNETFRITTVEMAGSFAMTERRFCCRQPQRPNWGERPRIKRRFGAVVPSGAVFVASRCGAIRSYANGCRVSSSFSDSIWLLSASCRCKSVVRINCP